MAKDKDYQQLIHTSQWLRLRKYILTNHPLCQRCNAQGVITPAREVHHVRPVEEAVGKADKRQRMYDPNNLQALCHNCHVQVHTEMGRSGRAANKERKAKQVEETIKRFFN